MGYRIEKSVPLAARALTASDRLDLMLESLAAAPAPEHLVALVDQLEQASADQPVLAKA